MTFSEIQFWKTENALEIADFQIGATMTWEAVVLPIYESCDDESIIPNPGKDFNHNLSNQSLTVEESLSI